MTTTTPTNATQPTRTELGAERAFMLLRTVFTIAPIAFGLDKFAEVLTDNWEQIPRPVGQRHRPRQRPPGDAGRRSHRDHRRHRRCRRRPATAPCWWPAGWPASS